MKIKEVTERDCCDPSKDFKLYRGLNSKNLETKFCVHCGQAYIWYRELGEMDYGWTKLDISLSIPE
jgi:hypothetical protein